MTNPTPTKEQMEAVAVILNANGIEVNLPWNGTLDDREREIFHAIESAVAVALRIDRHDGEKAEKQHPSPRDDFSDENDPFHEQSGAQRD